MPRPAPYAGPRPGRLLALYALAVMEREGPIYGYSLAERIAERTDGGWRPGAGAIYPALQSLVRRGLARSRSEGRRRTYTISRSGRALLTRVRQGWMGMGRSGPDLGMIWSEIAGVSDPGVHMLGHLRRHLDGISSYLEKKPEVRAAGRPMRSLVLTELRAAETRIRGLASSPPAARGSARGRRS